LKYSCRLGEPDANITGSIIGFYRGLGHESTVKYSNLNVCQRNITVVLA
jgi:hypothetical protein